MNKLTAAFLTLGLAGVLFADADTLLLGFGLDVGFDSASLAWIGSAVVAPAWTAVFAPDGDGLAGLAPPSGISGNGLVVATLTFQALQAGTTALTPSVTPGDLTEGFSLKSGRPRAGFRGPCL